MRLASLQSWIAILFLTLCSAASSMATIIPDDDVNLDEARTLWRWIGIKHPTWVGSGMCPPPPANIPWTVEPLFAQSQSPPVAELEKYCLYTFNQPGVVTHLLDLNSMVGVDLEELSTDRMVVHGLGDVLQSEIWRDLAIRFDEHTGRVDLPLEPNARSVRLTLIDTSPTSGMNPQQQPENSPHGHTLRRFADHLLCHQEKCIAETSSRLALGYKNFQTNELTERDEQRGGYYGTITELAQAIWLEALSRKGDPGQRLVLNLSVAWDPIYGGLQKEADEMPTDVRAVFETIHEVACQGGIMVAAAGNLSDQLGPTDGPLLPAAWAESSDISGDFCNGRGDWTPQLLYAVSGIQSTGEPLANSLQGSATELAAFADHAVIGDTASEPSGNEPTETLTGSSVAALVTSAAAAAVAYYRPDLSAYELMQEVYAAGDSLRRNAETCRSPPCREARYVSVCQAVARACTQSSAGFCPSRLPPCPRRSLTAASLRQADLSAFQVGNPNLTTIDAADLQVAVPAQICQNHQPMARTGFLPVDPCPHRQHHGLGRQPWSHPQPGSDPCPNCTLFPDSGGMMIAIANDFSGTLSDATLITCPDGGSHAAAYSLNTSSPLASGSMLAVSGLPTPGNSCTTAMLSFTVEHNGTVTSAISPLLIAQP